MSAIQELYELDRTIQDVERWHAVRSRLNEKPDRRKPLVMDTLPRALAFLKAYREVLQGMAVAENELTEYMEDPRDIDDRRPPRE